MGELEKIDGECSKYSVDFVFVQDNDEATDYGVREDISPFGWNHVYRKLKSKLEITFGSFIFFFKYLY